MTSLFQGLSGLLQVSRFRKLSRLVQTLRTV